MIRKWMIAAGMALCILYLLNPSFGFFELIPDNLPIIGNLDEGAAAALLIHLIKKWRQLGRTGSVPTTKSAPNVIDVPPVLPRNE